MRLAQRILIAPAIAILTSLVAAAVAVWAIVNLTQAMRQAADERVVAVVGVAEARSVFGEVHSEVYRTMSLVQSLSDAEQKQARERIVNRVADVRGAAERALATDEAGEEAERLRDVLAALDRYKKLADDAIDIGTVDPNTGLAAMQSADAEFKATLKLLRAANAHENGALEEAFAVAWKRKDLALIAVSATVLTGAVLALLTGLAMARRVTRDVARSRDVAVRVAEGDLNDRFAAGGPDETGELLEAMRTMVQRLAKVVGEVRHGVLALGSVSAEIAQGNQNLASRTEQQAGNIEQTAASLEQMTAGVGQNAEAARSASRLAVSASEVASKGGKMVQAVVGRMDAIQQASKRIAEIIGTIDGIAFQTNILALNAAVEAARAGEQGRGFAVVASEVRVLARRSAAAAREIRTLIDDTVQKVESGTAEVHQAGHTMGAIVEEVQRVTTLINEISTATMEQSSGIGQVNQAVAQIDQMTQQNATLVEQSAAAARSLNEQAGRLAEAVAVFKLVAPAA